MGRPSFAEVNEAALRAMPGLVIGWLPGAKKQAGEIIARNPTRADRRAGSFCVNARTGKWADFATNDRGGDPISLYAYLHGLNQGEACDAVAEQLGIAANDEGGAIHRAFAQREAPQRPDPEPEAPHDEWNPLLPVPEDAPELTPEAAARFAPSGYRFTEMWDYLDAQGALLNHVVRFDRPANGAKADKQVLPVSFCEGPTGQREWRSKALPEPRPLYGLPRLARDADALVIVVEGEKTADGAADRFADHVAVTSSGGSQAGRKADWRPLANRRVVIWPDHDTPGAAYADVIAAEIQAAGAAQIYRVTVPTEFPPKWDLGDAPPEGQDEASLRKLLGSAQKIHGNGSAKSKGPEPQWKQPRPLPSGLAPVMAFDPAMIPIAIGPWVADIADRMQCPPDFVGVSAMIGLATVLGRKIAIKPQEKTDWAEVPNLWGCIVGRPGAMKSPAMSEALKPINRLEAEARKANETELAAHKQRMVLHKIKVEVAQAKAKEAMKKGETVRTIDIEEPEAPTPKRFITNDSTYEKLGELMAANPNGLLVFRDELVTLLKMLDREEYAAARGFYLSAWNGTGSYDFDRIVRGLTHVDAVCCSMLGSTQPGKLAEYLARAVSGSAGDDGMIQRFGLLVWPDDNGPWKNVDRYPDSEARDTAWATFSRLDRLMPDEAGAVADRFDAIPHLRLDDAARDEFTGWRTTLEGRLRASAMHASLESHLSKYRKLVPALALINHLADGERGPVGRTAMLRALAFAEYLETHAKRAYGAGLQNEVAIATALLSKIRKGDLGTEFTARDVLQKDWSNLNNKAQVVAGLDLLDELDWLSARDVKTGGRAKTTYTINPRGLA